MPKPLTRVRVHVPSPEGDYIRAGVRHGEFAARDGRYVSVMIDGSRYLSWFRAAHVTPETPRRVVMRYGTAHFASHAHACRYYARQNESARTVERLLDEGIIHIGRPSVPDHAECALDPNEGRYVVTIYETTTQQEKA